MSTACASHGVTHKRAFSPWKLKKLDLGTKKKKKSPNYFLMKDPWGEKIFTVRPDYFENRISEKIKILTRFYVENFLQNVKKRIFKVFSFNSICDRNGEKFPRLLFRPEQNAPRNVKIGSSRHEKLPLPHCVVFTSVLRLLLMQKCVFHISKVSFFQFLRQTIVSALVNVPAFQNDPIWGVHRWENDNNFTNEDPTALSLVIGLGQKSLSPEIWSKFYVGQKTPLLQKEYTRKSISAVSAWSDWSGSTSDEDHHRPTGFIELDPPFTQFSKNLKNLSTSRGQVQIQLSLTFSPDEKNGIQIKNPTRLARLLMKTITGPPVL